MFFFSVRYAIMEASIFQEVRSMVEMLKSTETLFIAEGARVCGDVTLGENVGIWFNAVVRGDEGAITIGDNSNVQDCSVVHSRTVIGKGVTIGHNAIVHGCVIGDNCIIGMGSILLNGAKIGNNCIVGAGALVTGKADIPDGSLVVGSPAKVVRPLTPAEIANNAKNAAEYVELAKQYK